MQFSYVELEQATDKFSNANLIGLGGSSNVYRGQLQDGSVVAIKKLNLIGGQQADYDLLTEVFSDVVIVMNTLINFAS